MPRPRAVEVMFLGTIGLWSLNLTVTPHHPHARVPAARLRDRALRAREHRVRGADAGDRAVASGGAPRRRSCGRAAAFVYVNQIGFVYALDTTSASVIADDPRGDADLRGPAGLAFRTETLARRASGRARLLSFVGVARRGASATGGRLAGDRAGSCSGADHGSDLGRVLDPGHASHAALLGDPDQATVVTGSAWVVIALTSAGLSSPSQEWDLGWWDLGAARLRDARPLVLTNELVVPVARPDRAGARDARREPPAVPRRRDRRRAPLRDDSTCSSWAAAADRRRDPRRTTQRRSTARRSPRPSLGVSVRATCRRSAVPRSRRSPPPLR